MYTCIRMEQEIKIKTVKVSPEHHTRLRLRRRTGETFDEVIGRLLEESDVSVDDDVVDQMTA